MKLLVKDKSQTQFVVDHTDYEVQKRGGRGRRSSLPIKPLRAVPRLHLQLLPGQSIELTCPECGGVRSFSKDGSHYVNLTCKRCIEQMPGLDATERLADPVAGGVNIEQMLEEMDKTS